MDHLLTGSQNLFDVTYNYSTSSFQPFAVQSVSGGRTASYVYNTKGEMTSGDGRIFTYDSRGLVASISRGGDTVRYEYGIGGAQIYRSSTGSKNSNVTSINALYEIEVKGGVTKRHRRIEAGGAIVAISTVENEIATVKYNITDHLGSVVTTYNANGEVEKHYSYDPWGGERNANDWSVPSMALVHPDVIRGFTGHQVISSVGIIHMNGRLYDPLLGRFTSADPSLGGITSSQDVNRYSYVRNSPLSYTDPSGYFFNRIGNAFSRIGSSVGSFVKKYGLQIAAIAVAAVVAIYAPVLLNAYLNIATGTLGSAMATGAIGGAFSSAIASGGDLKATLQGAAFGAAFAWVGANLQGLDRVVAHGVIGGVRQSMNGGKFGSGFATGFVTAGVGELEIIGNAGGTEGLFHGGGTGNMMARIATAAVVGGTVSEITGDKFANGAVTGAFSRAFNDEAHAIFKNGTQDFFKGGGAKQFQRKLREYNSEGKTIVDWELIGHGDSESMALTGGNGLWGTLREGFGLTNDRIYANQSSIRLFDASEGKYINITTSMRRLLPAGSCVNLAGCNTATGENSMAQYMSQHLPGVKVTGSNGYLVNVYGFYRYQSRRTFLDGKELEQ